MRIDRRAALTAVALLSAVSLAACGGSPSRSSTGASSDDAASGAVGGEITVFAAASLQKAYEEISTSFQEANPGSSVTFDFQGSQDLVSNLAEGSTADVLATADTRTMDDAAGGGLVGEQREFATNVLSIIVPEGNPAGITGFDESLNAEGVNLVICDDQAGVPCGTATREMEEATGVTLHPASEETKVSSVQEKVESGEADAGIVYATNAASAKGTEEITIPDHGIVNHYPIATTASASNPAGGRAFVDFVLSDKGREILAKYGFGAPGGASAAPSSGAMTAAPTAPSSMPAETSKASEAASPGETGKPDEAGNKPDAETATP